MGVAAQRLTSAALSSAKRPGTFCTGGWVDPGPVFDTKYILQVFILLFDSYSVCECMMSFIRWMPDDQESDSVLGTVNHPRVCLCYLKHSSTSDPRFQHNNAHLYLRVDGCMVRQFGHQLALAASDWRAGQRTLEGRKKEARLGVWTFGIGIPYFGLALGWDGV